MPSKQTADNDATKRVLALRQSVDSAKTRLTEVRTKKRAAEGALSAADDAIEQLGLDPDRDLSRQVTRMLGETEKELKQLEDHLDEAESVLGGGKPHENA